MRVLQLITSLTFGGAERLLTDLVPRMTASGVDVRVLCVTSTMPLAPLLEQQSISVASLHCNSSIYKMDAVMRAAREVTKLIEAFKPDVIHSHLYMADMLARLASPRGSRLVTTLHGIERWWEQKHRLRSRAKTRIDSVLASMRRTRAIAVSNSVAIAAHAALSLPREKCRVVPNGTDLGRFQFNRRVPTADPVIVQVGRLAPEKGHRTSLQAFARLLQTHPRCRLRLVGHGPLEGELRALASSLGIEGRVEFLGARPDVPELLASGHVFWMPSDSEALGIACLEAMATGLPVIATRVGGIPEIVTHDVGHLVAPGDPEQLSATTARLLENYPAALEMGRRASARVVARYSIDTTARDYLNAYSDMVRDAW